MAFGKFGVQAHRSFRKQPGPVKVLLIRTCIDAHRHGETGIGRCELIIKFNRAAKSSFGWFAPAGDSYYLFSAGDAGKVKRLRNFSEVRIAACTVSGTLTGEWLETRAYLLEKPDDTDTALKALRHKYGWQMAIGDCFGRLTGKMKRRAYIRVERPTA